MARCRARSQTRTVRSSLPEMATGTEGVIFEQGDTIATEFTWAGTNTGPLVLPDGTELPPTGKRVQTKGMELVRISDGKIATHHEYWDNMALAGQLGLLPGGTTA
jgi:predicted ester cyclase